MAVGSLEQMELIKVFVEKYKGNVNFIKVDNVGGEKEKIVEKKVEKQNYTRR